MLTFLLRTLSILFCSLIIFLSLGAQAQYYPPPVPPPYPYPHPNPHPYPHRPYSYTCYVQNNFGYYFYGFSPLMTQAHQIAMNLCLQTSPYCQSLGCR